MANTCGLVVILVFIALVKHAVTAGEEHLVGLDLLKAHICGYVCIHRREL